jgi:hypothetical protein
MARLNLSFLIRSDSPQEFIAHWSAKYQYATESMYERNIGRPLTDKSRLELFVWKNGSVLSERKRKSLDLNYPLSFNGDVEKRYLQPGTGGGAIWNIFYAHCLSPNVWPIFDQHAYRAMGYILKGHIREIPTADREKLTIYRSEFVPFHQSFGFVSDRGVDKALFMFGKFLKTAKPYV